ncbi:MAG: TatD family hydrolase [Actinomycetota bacterium]|nr:TatD family hydrolase [Actinomycetota bacterium]
MPGATSAVGAGPVSGTVRGQRSTASPRRSADPGDAVVEWFDSHCHLQGAYLSGAGDEAGGGAPGSTAVGPGDTSGPGGAPPGGHALAGVLARAAEAGVTRLVCVGTDASTSLGAIELVRSLRSPGSAARAEGVDAWATVGLHPHDASAGVAATIGVLEEALAADDLVVAVGECGLDYHYDHSPRPAQREAFAAQVALAHQFGLALVVHTREAWDDTLDVLRSEGVPERTVVHCFTGGPGEARRCLDLGAVLSFSGVVTFKNAADVREAAALCPMDRMLVETDSPFLAPVPHRGSANEPSRVPLVGAVVAECQGVDRELLATTTTANARQFFGV